MDGWMDEEASKHQQRYCKFLQRWEEKKVWFVYELFLFSFFYKILRRHEYAWVYY